MFWKVMRMTKLQKKENVKSFFVFGLGRSFSTSPLVEKVLKRDMKQAMKTAGQSSFQQILNETSWWTASWCFSWPENSMLLP